jgi:hypothetical protein
MGLVLYTDASKGKVLRSRLQTEAHHSTSQPTDVMGGTVPARARRCGNKDKNGTKIGECVYG